MQLNRASGQPEVVHRSGTAGSLFSTTKMALLREAISVHPVITHEGRQSKDVTFPMWIHSAG
ncbi:hypothetical protein [Paraburkholderia sp. J69-2]|uniref:hypothetical protein n=1 Tax=Paraburkholderia sp. J69-2 TaxID=2805437 RepID=UPI002AB17536|nr:hypothetical protein [Paraburkholderia sp. J69-2]